MYIWESILQFFFNLNQRELYDQRFIWNIQCFRNCFSRIRHSHKIMSWIASMFTKEDTKTLFPDRSSSSMKNLPVLKLAFQFRRKRLAKSLKHIFWKFVYLLMIARHVFSFFFCAFLFWLLDVKQRLPISCSLLLWYCNIFIIHATARKQLDISTFL